MNPRFKACAIAANRPPMEMGERSYDLASEHFASHVFHSLTMQEMLPKAVYKHVEQAMDGEVKIDPIHADAIAVAMKEWGGELRGDPLHSLVSALNRCHSRKA